MGLAPPCAVTIEAIVESTMVYTYSKMSFDTPSSSNKYPDVPSSNRNELLDTGGATLVSGTNCSGLDMRLKGEDTLENAVMAIYPPQV